MQKKKIKKIIVTKRFHSGDLKVWKAKAKKSKMNLTEWMEQTLNKTEL